MIKEQKVLLGERISALGAGTWALPGGHLEHRESIEQCAKREVLEETGLHIKDIGYGPFTNDIFEQENKHYVTLFVTAQYDHGDLENKEPDKCERWDWFHWNKMPEPRFLSLQHLLLQNFDPFA